MTRVFISYSHDSDEHRNFVRGVADRLRKDGVDCLIDQYINGFPAEGWQRWMENQIEAADFVLLVCTETYLRRYRGQETEGGKGVNFEGVVISQILYDHYYKNTKFIPTIPDAGSFDHVPLPLKPYSTYHLNHQYNDVYRILTGQAEYEQPELGEVRQLPTVNAHSPCRIYSDDLPTVEGKLFGRTDELALLDQALNDNGIHIVQFVASGGTGKTKLIRTWLDENDDKINGLIAWSFYSQGSGEDKQISTKSFFIQALKSLGSDKSISDFHTEEEKGEYIADLLREKRCLLVLDGLEPLQQGGQGMRGKLKDRTIQKMLRCLAGDHSSLCIITTRWPVHELEGNKKVRHHFLKNLAPNDGVALLLSFKEPHQVYGQYSDMLAAVEEYGHHALALHLLGNALATYLDGDVRKRDTLTELIGDYDDVERHAFKVMQAYQYWLEGTPELKLLYLLGLFDHPVEQEVLEVLWAADIPWLTEGVPKKAWSVAQRDLTQKYQMMSKHEGQGDLFDCHPLIRKYFGRHLKLKKFKTWQQAHRTLHLFYDNQCNKNKQIDTLEQMEPFIKSITHACHYTDYKRAQEIYWRYISKGDEYYLNKISAFQEDLNIVSLFFEKPWAKLNYDNENVSRLGAKEENRLYRIAAYRLKSLGRLVESLSAIEKSTNIKKINCDISDFLVSVRSQVDLLLTLGKINRAIFYSKKTIKNLEYKVTEKEEEWIGILTIFARCQHQKGNLLEAEKIFEKVNLLLKSKNFNHKILYGLPGFRYCDLLICLKKNSHAEKIANHIIDIENKKGKNPLYIGLGELIIGTIKKNHNKINSAIDFLKKSNHKDHLPRGLITSSTFYTHSGKFNISFQFLNEAYEIAYDSDMRLHLTDYHLGMANLILAVEADPTQYPEATPDRKQRTLPFADQEEPGILTLKGHIAEAARLIQKTGYHRRDAELTELQKTLEKP